MVTVDGIELEELDGEEALRVSVRLADRWRRVARRAHAHGTTEAEVHARIDELHAVVAAARRVLTAGVEGPGVDELRAAVRRVDHHEAVVADEG